MEQREKDELKNTIALFRYGLISAVVNDTFEDKSQNEYFRRIAQSSYTLLGKEIRLAPATIKKWYIIYRKFWL